MEKCGNGLGHWEMVADLSISMHLWSWALEPGKDGKLAGKEVCTVGNTSSGSRKKMVDAGGGNTMYISPVSCTSFIIRKLKDDTDFKKSFC